MALDDDAGERFFGADDQGLDGCGTRSSTTPSSPPGRLSAALSALPSRGEPVTETAALLYAWRAIEQSRWTLLETVERGGRRYLLARVDAPRTRPRVVMSARERQVADLLGRGVAQKVIALELGISASTVSFHASNLAVRLGVASTAELVRHLAEDDEAGAWKT